MATTRPNQFSTLMIQTFPRLSLLGPRRCWNGTKEERGIDFYSTGLFKMSER